MKIAISSTGKDLTAQLDPRFGRCACFLIIDTDTMHFEAHDNPGLTLGGGAGIQAAQFVAQKGVQAVLTGNCGPNAVDTLSAAGIALYAGLSGSVRTTVERFSAGQLNPTGQPTVGDHFGMTAPSPQSAGSGPALGGAVGGGRCRGGGGRGMGGGGGRGMGGGMGMGRGMTGAPPATQRDAGQLSRSAELKLLAEQAETLQGQMAQIIARIRDLENQ